MGKNSVESSLKRFLKRRVKITLGFVVAFMIMGNISYAENYVINKEINSMIKNSNLGDNYTYNKKIDINDSTSAKGIFNYGTLGKQNTYAFKDEVYINLSATKSIAIFNTIGVMDFDKKVTLISDSTALNNMSTTTETAEITFKDIVNLTSDNGSTLKNSGIINFEKAVVITQNGIENADSDVHGIDLGDNSQTYFKNQLSIRVGSQNNVIESDGIGIRSVIGDNKIGTLNSLDRANIEIYTKKSGKGIEMSNLFASFKELDIKVNAKEATGIKVSNNSELNITENLNIFLEGDTLETGIEIHDGNVNLAGDVNIKASDYAIKAGNEYNIDYNGEVIINQNQNSTVNISGKIEASGKSKNLIDITFSNANSEFIGNTIIENQTSDINMEFSNEAVWNNTGDSSITNLTLNNGIINNTSIENNISIENLNGKGGTLNIGTEIDENGKATVGKIEIGKVNDNFNLDINYSNVGTDTELSKDEAKELLENLLGDKEHIVVKDGNLNGTASLEEGFITDGYEAEFSVDKNGGEIKDVVTTGKNSMVEGISDLATINLLTWRQEMNSLNKRMGELRNSTGEHGVWSRVYTGKIENGDRYDNDYQTYQVGYDKKYSVDNGVMFVGGLVSYSKGETNYELGEGENYSVGAGIYATWLNNDGYFADVVLKQSRLHNKFDVTSKDLSKSQSGDYNNWGTSLSGQYGKRFDVSDKLFIEPSAELTLGRVEDTTYITSAGVNVHQDTMYSLVGNIGTAVGYKFNDKGNIYTRVSLVREFQGDIDTYYEYNSVTNETHEDLADTWIEFGIGANYRFAEDLNIYVDLQKTGEATVDTEWQANLGFRYEF